MGKINTSGSKEKLSAVDTLAEQYEVLRKEETRIKKAKDEIAVQLKAAFGDKVFLPSASFKLSYDYDADKMTRTVDWDEFKKAEPKVYKKWVHEETVKGSRRINITRITEDK